MIAMKIKEWKGFTKKNFLPHIYKAHKHLADSLRNK